MLELHRKEQEDEREQYSKEQIKKYKEDNHKLSLFLMKYEKRGETKIWKAEPININRTTELGKLLAAHEWNELKLKFFNIIIIIINKI